MNNTIPDLRIDEEFKRLEPEISTEEYASLLEDIISEGRIHMPIVTWHGVILDGYNRYRILKDNPYLEYQIIEKDFDNRFEAISWICTNLLGKRSLTAVQRSYIIGKKYQAEKHTYGARDGFRGNQYITVGNMNGDLNFREKHKTASRIAKEFGVSPATVGRCARFVKGLDEVSEVSPSLYLGILGGEYRVTAQDMIDLLEAPEQEKMQIVRRIAEQRIPKGEKKHDSRSYDR